MAYKGYLQKTEQGWIVIYDQRTMQDPSAEDGILLVSDYGDRETVLDKKQNLNFYSGKEVDFEMVEEKFDGNNTMNYAKIIHKNIKPEQNDVERLAEEVYGKGVNYDYEEGFVDGYNKAKETLYTEEDDEINFLKTQLKNVEYYKLGYNCAKETLYTEEQMELCWIAAMNNRAGFSDSISYKKFIQSLKQK